MLLSASLSLAAYSSGLQTFSQWQSEFGRQYSTLAAEAQARANFEENARQIAEHNARNAPFQLGFNQFSDMSHEEYKRMVSVDFGRYIGDRSTEGFDHAVPFAPKSIQVPSSVDWEAAGKVSPVIEQGKCGACWSIGTTGAVESAYAIATGNLVSLSFEDLLKCDYEQSPIGGKKSWLTGCACNGGDPFAAFEFFAAKGAVTFADDPFNLPECDMYNRSVAQCNCGDGMGDPPCPTPAKQTCPGQCVPSARKPVATIANYSRPADGSALLQAVASGPAVTLIDCETPEFKNYKGGVLTTCSDNLHNHVVLVVGFGTENGVDYWKIKNSMGTTWGEKGYLRIIRGNKTCGIEMENYQPHGAAAWKGSQ